MLKHLDSLRTIQRGHGTAVMLHIAPTNVCNQHCVHCCFSKRDRSLSLTYEQVVEGIRDFFALGARAVEYTGGGEPTMWPHLESTINFCTDFGIAQGMNTNALQLLNSKVYTQLDWCRVALNVFDSDSRSIKTFSQHVELLRDFTDVTACYIVPQQIGTKNLLSVVSYAVSTGLPTRIAPDCIQSLDGIKKSLEAIKRAVHDVTLNEIDENIFVSDFNVYTDERENDNCFMHVWKPLLYADGYVYTCPSSELAMENGRTMQEKFRVCAVEDVKATYREWDGKPKNHSCSYCKYTRQNNLLSAVTKETMHNDFT